jgi:hypothetical protein
MPTGSRGIIIYLAVGLKEQGFHVDVYMIFRGEAMDVPTIFH